jgi:hypothetical protein
MFAQSLSGLAHVTDLNLALTSLSSILSTIIFIPYHSVIPLFGGDFWNPNDASMSYDAYV